MTANEEEPGRVNAPAQSSTQNPGQENQVNLDIIAADGEAQMTTGPKDVRDREWLDRQVADVTKGVAAVIVIARNWTEQRNVSRFFPGTSAADYIREQVGQPRLDKAGITLMLAETTMSNREIAKVAGVSPQTVGRVAATVPDGTVRPAKTVGADGKARGPRRIGPAPEHRLGHVPEENPDGMAGDTFWRNVRRIAHPEIDGRPINLILADYRVLTSKARRSGEDPAVVLAELKAARDRLSEAVTECAKEDQRSALVARVVADDGTVEWVVA